MPRVGVIHSGESKLCQLESAALCARKEVKDSSRLVAADAEDAPVRDLSGHIALKAKVRIDST
jgi:hypothetical protein